MAHLVVTCKFKLSWFPEAPGCNLVVEHITVGNNFSQLYTSIPHDLLKSRMNNMINNAFKHENGATRYTHVKVDRSKSYFTSDPLNGDNKYTTCE